MNEFSYGSAEDISRDENLKFLSHNQLVEAYRGQMAMNKTLQRELDNSNKALAELRLRFEKIRLHVDKATNPLSFEWGKDE